DARYQSGRTATWIKVKCIEAKEFAVGGYVRSERRSFFKSLLVGEPTPKGLVYRGQVGSGFTEALGKKIAGMLKPLAIDRPALVNVPWALRSEARWVRPEYIAMVRSTEITRDGVLRHPRFVRLRHMSEPGVAEHLRSKTIADRVSRKRRARPRPPPPKPDRPALLDALRKSVRGKAKRARRRGQRVTVGG